MLVLSFNLITELPAQAKPDVTVTPAANGENISADTAGGAWTELGPITIAEGAPGDIDDGFFTLTIPSGFEFDMALPNPDVATAGAGGQPLLAVLTAITATTITVNVTSNSTTAAYNLTIGGVNPIRVHPTAGTPLASGNITCTTPGQISGVTGATNFGTLTEVAGAITTLSIIQQPTDTLVNVAIAPPVTVRATDQYTNNVSSQNITAALLAGTGALTGTFSQVTNASGIATFNDLEIDTVGPGKVLRFSFGGVHVDSNQFNIVTAGIIVNPAGGLVTTEDGGGATFAIVLTSQPTANVTIGFSSTDETEGRVSPTGVIFTSVNWNTPRTISIIGIDDSELDGDIAYVVVTAPAVSDDGNYNGLDASDVSVINRDNDTIPHNPQEGLTDVSNLVTNEGLFRQQVTAASGDNNVQLVIDQGITGLTTAGTSLSQILILAYNFPPAPPEQASVIGLTYDIRPDGAIFDKPVTISFTYNPINIPTGVDEEDLSIAFYDDINGEWVVLENITVDQLTHTITGQTTHFTAFTVLAFTEPASFTVSALVLSPGDIYTGETATVSVVVTNTGDLAGSYTINLMINDIVLDTTQVTLDGNTSQTVSFDISLDTAGTYNITIGTLSAVLTVKELQTPAPTPIQTPAPTLTEEIAPSPTQTTAPSPTSTLAPTQPPEQPAAPTPAPAAAESGINWGLIGGIIGGIIIVAGGLWLYLARRRD